MSFNYKFIDHTADIAADLFADSLEELFVAGAESWKESVMEKFEVINPELKYIELIENSPDELLVSFVDELNFKLITKKWVYNDVNEIKIEQKEDQWILNCKISGEKLNEKKHTIKTEIKAVTFHQMDIKEVNRKFITRIVYDI